MLKLLRQWPVQLGALAFVVTLAYANSLDGAFVLDDADGIVSNSSLQSLATAFDPPRNTTLAGRPVANLSFALNYSLTGLSPTGLHVTNALIHLLTAIALLLLARRTLRLPRFEGLFEQRRELLSLAIAALWVAHPIQTESVTYLVQRVEALGALFILLTLLASLRSNESGRARWTVAASLAAIVGVGAKETAAVAPLLVVLFDRAFLFDTFASAWRQRWRLYAAVTLSWIPAALIQASGPRSQSAGLHFSTFGPWPYLKIQAGAIVHYLQQMLWPSGLTFDFGEVGIAVPVPQAPAEWLLPGLFVVALLVASVWAWRWSPPVGFVATAFFILLAPSSSIIPIRTEAIAEHRVYLPLACVVTLLLLGLHRLLQPLPNRVLVLTTLVVGTVAALTTLTVERNELFDSPVALWSDVVARRPQNTRGWDNLGAAYRLAGRRDESVAAYERAVSLAPMHKTANLALAADAEARRDYDRAIEIYTKLRPQWPGTTDILFNLANCYVKTRRWGEAAEVLPELLRLKPADDEAHGLFGEALSRLGQKAEAHAAFSQAVALAPQKALHHYRLGSFLIEAGDPAGAARSLEQALAQDPTMVLAKHRLALLSSDAGDHAKAIALLNEVVQQEPSRLPALQDLAWLLSTAPDEALRNGAKALELATREHEATGGKSVRGLEVFAAALAENGRYADAVRHQQQAIAATPSPSREMQERLSRYEQAQSNRAQTASAR